MLLFLNRDYEQSDMSCCWSAFALVYIYLDDRAFFGMKAKSSKGKNSFGPIIPNPFVRFEWSLGKELKYVEISMTFKLKVSLVMILIVQILQMNGKEVPGRWKLWEISWISQSDLQEKSLQIGDGIWGQRLHSQHREHDAQPHWNKKHFFFLSLGTFSAVKVKIYIFNHT